MKYVLGLVLSLSVASFAFGDSWAEVGDAGDQLFTGFQDTVGMPGASLDSITGATDTGVGDAHDAYRITIDSADWSIQAAGFDTRLWLFDTAGNLLMSNDDGFDNDGNALPGFNASLSSTANWAGGINGAPIDPVVGDQAILVISGFSETLLDAAGNAVSQTGGFTDLNGQTGGDPVDWEFYATGFAPASGAYDITLKGVGFGSVVPEPAAGLVLVSALALAAIRRKR